MARQDPLKDSCVGVILKGIAFGMIVFGLTAIANWVVG